MSPYVVVEIVRRANPEGAGQPQGTNGGRNSFKEHFCGNIERKFNFF